MKKTTIIFSALLLIVGAGSFFGGMKYQQSKTPTPNFQRLGNGQAPTGAGQTRGGLVNGEILSKDESSLTVKLRDGGSKLILIDSSTKITKSTEGTSEDLSVGASVMVSGETNTDGSVSAKTIQLANNP